MVLSVLVASASFAGTAAAQSGSLTFDDQAFGSDGAVTVANVSTGQSSTVVVTYTNESGSIIVAGTASADNLSSQDVPVAIEDAGGFPGEHTAWVFADEDLSGVSLAPGDDVLNKTGLNASQVQALALDFESANVTAPETATETSTPAETVASQPGFGPGVAIAALALVTVLALRRRD